MASFSSAVEAAAFCVAFLTCPAFSINGNECGPRGLGVCGLYFDTVNPLRKSMKSFSASGNRVFSAYVTT